MTSTEIFRLLQEHQFRVFTTADLITLTGLAASNATATLARLASRDLLVRIKRGVWVNKSAPDLNPYEALPHLRTPWPAYASLHSALALTPRSPLGLPPKRGRAWKLDGSKLKRYASRFRFEPLTRWLRENGLI